VNIYWPGIVILLYTLCGLGFTVQWLTTVYDRRTERSRVKEISPSPVV
jgi:hypothetical protein